MGLICFAWYSQSDRQKILESPWSVLDIEPHGPVSGYRTQVWDKMICPNIYQENKL